MSTKQEKTTGNAVEHVGITSEATSGDSIATSEEVSNEVFCLCKSDRASHQQNCF